jgi:hypothetical protein
MAPHMDPWTLAYLAGHRDMNITKRYVHPQEQTIRAAMDRVQVEKGGHTSWHTGTKRIWRTRRYRRQPSDLSWVIGAPGEIRTPDLLVRSQPLYPTELRAHKIKALAFLARQTTVLGT